MCVAIGLYLLAGAARAFTGTWEATAPGLRVSIRVGLEHAQAGGSIQTLMQRSDKQMSADTRRANDCFSLTLRWILGEQANLAMADKSQCSYPRRSDDRSEGVL